MRERLSGIGIIISTRLRGMILGKAVGRCRRVASIVGTSKNPPSKWGIVATTRCQIRSFKILIMSEIS